MVIARNKILQACFSFVLGALVFWFFPAGAPEHAKRMVFLFVLAALFWAMEIIPLFATALLVVLGEIFLFAWPGRGTTNYQVFLAPFSNPIIMLFLGGFILARAMQKYQLDQLMAQKLLPFFGHKPSLVVFGFMGTTAFLSMWMSNTATTALMLVLIRPLLEQIKEGDPLKKALVLAIPFGANIGGIGTPVGTPPNAIAIGLLAKQNVHLGFVQWMMMAVPLMVIMVIVTSLLLNRLFRSHQSSISFSFPEKNPVGHRPRIVAAVFVLAVFLWLTAELHHISDALVALFFATLLFSLGLLDRNDLKTIDWDILILMWGGLALGDGMKESGLTQWMVGLPFFSQKGLALVASFVLLTVALSTFMSNTAATNLLVPLAIAAPGEDKVLLAVIVALASSFDIAIPISTPPNAMAFATGAITAKDMLKVGVWVTLISMVFLIFGSSFMVRRTFGGDG